MKRYHKVHLAVQEPFVIPPLPPAVHAPANIQSASDTVLSEWLNDLDRAIKTLQNYNTNLEISSLTYWVKIIETAGAGYRTNVLSVRDALEKAVASLQDIDKSVIQSKKLARVLSANRNPLAHRATLISANLAKTFKLTKGLIKGLSDQATRIVEQLPNPQNTEVSRAAAIYEQALKLVIGKEGFSWKLHDIQTADPLEALPWFEVFVSPEVRSDRQKLRSWERKIDQAVEDVDPVILGSIGINYSTVSSAV